MVTKGLRERLKVGSKPLQSLDPGPRFDLPGPGAAMLATDLERALGDRRPRNLGIEPLR